MEFNLPKTLVDLARRVVEENTAAGRTLSLAESCTGGLVSAAITEIPGSSAVLRASFVTYDYEAKEHLLGVNHDMLHTFGAVSLTTVWAMARGAQAKADADVAVAISGIAGPAGGTPKKPVGTVVFARANRGDGEDDSHAVRMDFGETLSRSEIRLKSALYALELLLPDTPDP